MDGKDGRMMTDPGNNLYAPYLAALVSMDKPACVQLVLAAVSEGKVGLVELYTEVLAKSLNELSEAELGQPDAICANMSAVKSPGL
ncbi:MAG: hypothetical protein LRY35_01290 [Clostridiales bacterium]|nr:hypothetical protein [Clostridiales bacterium]